MEGATRGELTVAIVSCVVALAAGAGCFWFASRKDRLHPAGFRSGSGWYAGGGALVVAGVLGGIGTWLWISGWPVTLAIYAASVGAAAIGLLVGLTELLARYKDEPTRAMRTGSGLLYMALNATASVVALLVLIAVRPHWLFGEGCDSCELTGLPLTLWLELIAVSGLGAAALFRSSLAKIKMGDTDSAIGPAVLLDTLLTTTDRAVDRQMAGPRGERVTEIMAGISFERAKDVLPAYCFSLMQNVSPEEAQRVSTNINALESARFPDRVRALVLGLQLMSVVGYDVFKAAVDKTKELMQEEWSEGAPLVKVIADSRSLDPKALCLVLTPYVLALKPKMSRNDKVVVFAAVNAIEKGERTRESKNVGIMLKLFEFVEPPIVAFALRQLAPGLAISPGAVTTVGPEVPTEEPTTPPPEGPPGGPAGSSAGRGATDAIPPDPVGEPEPPASHDGDPKDPKGLDGRVPDDAGR